MACFDDAALGVVRQDDEPVTAETIDAGNPGGVHFLAAGTRPNSLPIELGITHFPIWKFFSIERSALAPGTRPAWTISINGGCPYFSLAVDVVFDFSVHVDVIEARLICLRIGNAVVANDHPWGLYQPGFNRVVEAEALTIQPNNVSSPLFLPVGAKGVAVKSKQFRTPRVL